MESGERAENDITGNLDYPRQYLQNAYQGAKREHRITKANHEIKREASEQPPIEHDALIRR